MKHSIVKVSGTGFTVKFAFEKNDEAEAFLCTAYEALLMQNDENQTVEISIYETKE